MQSCSIALALVSWEFAEAHDCIGGLRTPGGTTSFLSVGRYLYCPVLGRYLGQRRKCLPFFMTESFLI